MITIATLRYLATLSNVPVEELSTPRERALAVFAVATRFDGVKWYAKDALVAVLRCGTGEFTVPGDDAEIEEGTLVVMLDTVERLVAGLDEPLLKPTPTACAYRQFGVWVDVQNGYLMFNPMSPGGGWDEDFAAVEFACQHLVEHANADFGTSFTMDDFEEGDDCSCVS
jgi:hypothetical protein